MDGTFLDDTPKRRAQGSRIGTRVTALIVALLLVGCARTPPQDAGPRLLEGPALVELAGERPFEERDGAVHWRAGSAGAWPVRRALAPVWLEVETPVGRMRVIWSLVSPHSADVLADLPGLLAHATTTAPEPGPPWQLSPDPLLGLRLERSGLLMLREAAVPAIDPDGLVERAREAHARARDGLRAAIDGALDALPNTDLDLGSRRAAADIVEQLDEHDAQEDFDFVLPSFARRLVRNGWLESLALPETPRRALEDAVRSAERLLPVALHETGTIRVATLEDALGQRVHTLRTPERAGFSRLAPRPAYYTVPDVHLVVRVPPDADPLRDAQRFVAAELHARGAPIATWTQAAGLDADPELWRTGFPVRGDDVEDAALADALPPHVVVVEPDGDVIALITRYGVLRPARGADQAEAFFEAAARTLPDAAHLDLIGQYLLVYAYDSPDPERPALIGTRQASGDIHQTAKQTLDTFTGGMYRGDCDDLSELYQVISARQGRNAHLIGLPAHAALAWSESHDDGTWRTYVLQTGQPLAFEGDTLPGSLERVYRSFGAGEVLDVTRLEILLRFSGENTRSSWYLSHRIFSDPSYAAQMVDIQRDWHFQTYQRAIEKVKRIIGDGDDDVANYGELAGLYRYTGQYAPAADALAEALARTEEPQTRLSTSIDRVLTLFDAGRDDAARALARDVRETLIPAIESARDVSLLGPRLSLVDALRSDRHELPMALDVLAHDVKPIVDEAIRGLAWQIQSDGFDPEVFESHEEALRYRLRWFAVTATEVLSATADGPQGAASAEGGPPSDWESVSESVWAWLSDVAFHDVESSESVLARYALLGKYYATLMSEEELEKRVLGAAVLESPDRDHTARRALSGRERVEEDFRWIAASPLFHLSQLGELFGRERKTLDVARALDLAGRVSVARTRATALGLDHPSFDDATRTSRLVAALVAPDPKALREILREPLVRNDRRVRLDVSSWIAAVARFVSLDSYAATVDVWREEIDYKPMYFWIAWSAALTGATDHALLVAELAANQFRDDPAFLEEYEAMRQRFAPDAARIRTPAPPAGRRPDVPVRAGPPSADTR